MTRPQPSCWPRPSRRCRPSRDVPLRQDYEYRREGTRNRFLACEPLAGWRQVAITERRTMQDFAQQMRWLVDEAYPEIPVVRVVRVVLDNLNTHRVASLVRDLPGSRGAADCQTAGVPLHPQAWQLVEPGRNRVQRTVPFLPEAAAPRRRRAAAGSRGLGCGTATRPKSPSTGGSRPRMPEPSSIASIPSIPNMTDY